MLNSYILISLLLIFIFSFIIHKINKNDVSSLKKWSIGFLVLYILIFIVLVYIKYNTIALNAYLTNPNPSLIY
jgi:hypothetical protein